MYFRRSLPARRNALGAITAGIAGFLGLATFTRSAEAASRPPDASNPPSRVAASGATLILSSPAYLIQAINANPNNLIGPLVDQSTGAVAGEFRCVRFATPTPFQKTAFNRDSVQHHVFTLANGEIYGIGTTVDDDGDFAVLGGTGAYANVIGTYHAKITDRRRGGAQTAMFSFQLMFLNQLFVPAAWR